MQPSGEIFPIQRSNLYHIWLLEQKQIRDHKWYLSEQAGFDVGWDRAKWDWGMRFRPSWVADLKASGIYPTG